MSQDTLHSPTLLRGAERAFRAAEGAILTAFRTGAFTVSWKPDGSPVTNIDQAAEAVIRGVLEAQFPDHGFFGEESGTARTDSPYCWIVDPIDGTKSFISGLPTFATLIGFAVEGIPRLGLAGFPALGRCFTASRLEDGLGEGLEDGLGEGLEDGLGGGTARAFENGAPLALRNPPPLNESVALLGNPMALERLRPGASEKLRQAFAMLRYGADTLAPILVAQGSLQVVLEADYDYYDYAALVPIVEAQGGIITDWHGNPLTATTPPEPDGAGVTVLAAVNEELHHKALELLR